MHYLQKKRGKMRTIDNIYNLKNVEKNLHAGHRSRLRINLIDNKWEDFNEHQLLEYILSICIPRKDTNPIAHRLIDEFGSLANVMDASPVDLEKINGVGNVTATFLHSIPNIFKAYKKSKMKENPSITCPSDAIKYFASAFNHMPNEEFYVVCVDATGKLINKKLIAKGDCGEVAFTTKSVMEFAVRTKAQGILFFHNHPNGECSPSPEDIQRTKQLYYNFTLSNIAVLDHIIVGKFDNSYFSFKESGLLDEFGRETFRLMGNDISLNIKKPPYTCFNSKKDN